MRGRAKAVSVRAVLWAIFLVLVAAAAHADECTPNTTVQSLTGKLAFYEEDVSLVGTPYSLDAGQVYHALFPGGSFFGMAEGDPGYEKNADAKLEPFLGRQITVTGCAGIDADGFRWVERISAVQAA